MTSVCGRKTLVDLIELDKLNFDVILGIDLLHSCNASLDCQTEGSVSTSLIRWWSSGKVFP